MLAHMIWDPLDRKEQLQSKVAAPTGPGEPSPIYQRVRVQVRGQVAYLATDFAATGRTLGKQLNVFLHLLVWPIHELSHVEAIACGHGQQLPCTLGAATQGALTGGDVTRPRAQQAAGGGGGGGGNGWEQRAGGQQRAGDLCGRRRSPPM
jgi:hypothetical protein